MGHCFTLQGLGLYYCPLPKAVGVGRGLEARWMDGSKDPVTTVGCARREG